MRETARAVVSPSLRLFFWEMKIYGSLEQELPPRRFTLARWFRLPGPALSCRSRESSKFLFGVSGLCRIRNAASPSESRIPQEPQRQKQSLQRPEQYWLFEYRPSPVPLFVIYYWNNSRLFRGTMIAHAQRKYGMRLYRLEIEFILGNLKRFRAFSGWRGRTSTFTPWVRLRRCERVA